MPEEDPDVQLMLALKRGDEAAFRHLFEKHAAAVMRYAMQFVGSRARAEEIAQDVFLQVYRNRLKYEPKARFVTWLYRMVNNSCISESRRAEHRESAYSLDQPSPSAEGGPPPAPDPAGVSSEDVIEQRQSLDRLKGALDGLPPQQRAAILLARVEGLSYDEVAKSLVCSVSAVKSLIHRATLTLRARVQEAD